MAVMHQSYLLDGPLMRLPDNREGLVVEMANALSEFGTYADRQDAIRVLANRGFKTLDIFVLVDDAMAVAVQDQVAREMGQS